MEDCVEEASEEETSEEGSIEGSLEGSAEASEEVSLSIEEEAGSLDGSALLEEAGSEELLLEGAGAGVEEEVSIPKEKEQDASNRAGNRAKGSFLMFFFLLLPLQAAHRPKDTPKNGLCP